MPSWFAVSHKNQLRISVTVQISCRTTRGWASWNGCAITGPMPVSGAPVEESFGVGKACDSAALIGKYDVLVSVSIQVRHDGVTCTDGLKFEAKIALEACGRSPIDQTVVLGSVACAH